MRWGRLVDIVKPKESVQFVLRENGKPTAGVYVDGKREVRSPSLNERGDDEGTTPRRR